MQASDIIDKIRTYSCNTSPQKAKIVRYLLKHPQKAALLSATKLSMEIGVSQPTLTRFVQELGFTQYRIFQISFQDLLLSDLTSAERYALNLADTNAHQGSVTMTLSNEIKALSSFFNAFPKEQFDLASQKIFESKRVCVIGTGISGVLAQHMKYYLSRVKTHIFCITRGASEDYEELLKLAKGDTVIAISTYRYGKETIELVEFCKQRNVGIIAITDFAASPVAAFSEIILTVPVSHGAIFDSHCSIFCLSIMMATRLASLNKMQSRNLFEEYENLARVRMQYTDRKRNI